MTRLDAEVLRIWLGGESATVVLRHACRLGCELEAEADVVRLAEAAGGDWRAVREAARDERNRRGAERAYGMTDDEMIDFALEDHGLPPDAYDALERAAAADAFGETTDELELAELERLAAAGDFEAAMKLMYRLGEGDG